MTPTASYRWVKRYPTPVSCRAAGAHHQWLAELGAPVPRLRTIAARHLVFDHVTGRHAEPRDLPLLADLLGRLHHVAYATELHRARLDRPHTLRNGLTIPGFIAARQDAVARLLSHGAVPSAPLTTAQAVRKLEAAVDDPPCLYKDSNPRNFLITEATAADCVLVDFDILTLAPAGYDLAKLIVTLSMTHGPLPISAVQAALTVYNSSFTDGSTNLRSVSWDALMTWADIHYILTSPYLGRGGYRYPWSGLTRG